MVLILPFPEGEKPQGGTLILHTRRGRPIPNQSGLLLTQPAFVQQQMYQRTKWADSSKLRVRKEPCGLYNCHGMTFLSRRALLLKDSDVQIVLEDDEYYPVGYNEVLPGDVVLYYSTESNGSRELEHSGIVVRVQTVEGIPYPWVLSKWGNGGEYIHRYDYCPYLRDSVIFMREGQNDELTL